MKAVQGKRRVTQSVVALGMEDAPQDAASAVNLGDDLAWLRGMESPTSPGKDYVEGCLDYLQFHDRRREREADHPGTGFPAASCVIGGERK